MMSISISMLPITIIEQTIQKKECNQIVYSLMEESQPESFPLILIDLIYLPLMMRDQR